MIEGKLASGKRSRAQLMLVLAVLMTSGCEAKTTTFKSENETTATRRLLEEGRGEACTSGLVISTIEDMVAGQGADVARVLSPEHYRRFRQGLRLGVTEISLDSVTPEVKSVRCRGTLRAGWDDDGWESPITYEVRPALDSDAVLVNVLDYEAANAAVLRAMHDFDRQVRQPERERAEAKRADELAVDPVYQMTNEANRICNRESDTAPYSEAAVAFARRFIQEVREDQTSSEHTTWACMTRIAKG